jgi:hypothetical protein
MVIMVWQYVASQVIPCMAYYHKTWFKHIIGFVLEPLTVLLSVIFSIYPKPIDKSKDYKNVLIDRLIPVGIVMAVTVVLGMIF